MGVKENVEKIKLQISRAAAKTGRSLEDIIIVAVTKTYDINKIMELKGTGIQVIGENRVQEAWEKYPEIKNHFNLHLVGHVQSNKAKRAAFMAQMIHSVDSVDLARILDKECAKLQKKLDILLEVNTSGEGSKFGFSRDKTGEAAIAIGQMPCLKLCGLMTMAPFVEDPEKARPFFAALRELRDRLQTETLSLPILSMGMSNDFAVAVEEGATIVRIGTAIFGERHAE